MDITADYRFLSYFVFFLMHIFICVCACTVEFSHHKLETTDKRTDKQTNKKKNRNHEHQEQ